MLPENKLSAAGVYAPWVNPERRSLFYDFEWGGADVQDNTKGLHFALWRSSYDAASGEITLKNNQVERVVLTVPQVTELSFAFDLNMQPVVVYVAGNQAHLYWYDSQAAQMVTTPFPGIENPRLTLDDRRPSQSANADVLLVYTRNKVLYVRNQRERYLVEHELGQVKQRLWHVSMMQNYRVGFMLKN